MKKSWKDLTAEQYLELIDLEDDRRIYEIIFEKKVNDIPLKYLNPETIEFLKTDPEKEDIRFYKHDGVTYGMVRFDDMSMGEYIDLSTFSQNWKENIWKMMAVLYRPITGWNLKHKTKFALGKFLYFSGLFWKIPKLTVKGTSMLMNMDYKVTKYQGDQDLKREHIYRDMSAGQFHTFLLFFLNLYMRSIADILKSTEQKTPQKNPLPKKRQQNSRSKAGDGTTS